MIHLPNNCQSSQPTVSPKNWKTGGIALLKKKWRIHYYFRDPSQPADWQERFPHGKLITVKGMNEINDLSERRAVTQAILDTEKRLLDSGYNPVIKKIVAPVAVNSHDVTEKTPFLHALQKAMDTKKATKGVKIDLKSVLKYISPAAREISITEKNGLKLYLADLPVGQVRRKHINILLNYMPNVKEYWSDNTFNQYRAHLSMLFKELLKFEAVEFNPVNEIERYDVDPEIRTGLTREQRHTIDMHLRKKKLHSFRLYCRIFYHSAIRSTELLKVQGKDVNLTRQTFKCTIKKGKRTRTVNKTIKNIAVRYWKLALKNCGPEDYVFAKGLLPGPVPIQSYQITLRWNRHVKAEPKDGGLGIPIDFYDHKHSNATEVAEEMGDDVASGLMSHTNTTMLKKVYDINRMSREHEEIKKAANHY